MRSAIIAGVFAWVLSAPVIAAQRADNGIDTAVENPTFMPKRGPMVAIDEGHHNVHTSAGTYAPFADLLRHDGFRVSGIGSPITTETLAGVNVFVIANALNAINETNWSLPTPSAFHAQEIDAINAWVRSGGGLLIITDHMPFPGAVSDLARSFGFELYNSVATRVNDASSDIFSFANGMLRPDVITRGANEHEEITSIETFGGSAFKPPTDARSVLVFTNGYTVFEPPVAMTPQNAAQVARESRHFPAAGLSQGAVLPYGKGRVAIFGEAAMFSAQLLGPQRRPFGFNVPEAKQNKQFALNVLHWLAGRLPDR